MIDAEAMGMLLNILNSKAYFIIANIWFAASFTVDDLNKKIPMWVIACINVMYSFYYVGAFK